MDKERINIVWIKRDIRSHDHVLFFEADSSDLPYLPIFIFEPTIISCSDTSLRHLQFQYHSLVHLNNKLKEKGVEVSLFYAEASQTFEYLNKKFDIITVFSYQESGTEITFKRDKYLKKWFSEKGIIWQEFQRDGIVRGIKNRDGWDKAWFEAINRPLIINIFSKESVKIQHSFPIPEEIISIWKQYPSEFQPAGEDYAHRYLISFMAGRALGYSKNLSKPTESRTSCTRLSPYLAWGNISLKFVYQNLRSAAQGAPKLKFHFENAMTRLKWHCHFIQKFENQCDYENAHVNQAYNSFQFNTNIELLTAWKSGNTGMPLVDACMRCLHQTGWINFRMRSMLVSFLTHYLLIDWREGVYHLAQLFLDYEPGIHFTQFQMQACTTGINTIRIYNPIKQSTDHDPDGIYIKKWVTELKNVPSTHIHEPWKMTILEMELYQCVLGKDYPFPVLDFEKEIKKNRELLWSFKKTKVTRSNNAEILRKHARPKKQNN